MFGYAAHDLLGASFFGLLEPSEAERARHAMGRRDPGRAEYVARRSDGTKFDVELFAREKEFDGLAVQVVAVRDVTQRKLQEVILRRNERLASLGTLVAGIAHEINNPLTYIRGNLELVALAAQEIQDDPRAAPSKAGEIFEEATVALRGIERLGELAQGLRKVARPPTRERKPTDVNEVVQQILPVIRAKAAASTRIELRAEASRQVMASEDELAQILLNLALNALDALAVRGERVELRTFDEGESAVIEVSDDGPGIREADKAGIFTPFFTTKAQGTGLGLSISHSIAQDLGGTLTFTSSDEGTTFRLTIPFLHERKAGPT